jgi:hypothetical protein
MTVQALDARLLALLAALRVQIGSASDGDPSFLAECGVDWTSVLELSRRHGVAPLAYAALQRCGIRQPAGAEQEWRAEFQSEAASGLLYGRELARIQRHLHAFGIAAIAFKGPALALKLYGALGLRPCRDLDLVVRKRDLEPAAAVLERLGYRCELEPGAEISPTEKHIIFRDGQGFAVELHWAVSRPSFSFSMGFDELWPKRETVQVLGVSVAAPGPEDLPIALCAHGTAHSWGSLKWICDIALLLKSPDLDWERTFGKAQQTGAGRMLLTGVSLANELLRTPLPVDAQRRIAASPAVRALTASMLSGIFSNARPQPGVERVSAFMRSRERLLDRLRIAIQFLAANLRPTARDRELVRVPRIFGFVYWPLRLARLIASYSGEIGAPLLAALSGRRNPAAYRGSAARSRRSSTPSHSGASGGRSTAIQSRPWRSRRCNVL